MSGVDIVYRGTFNSLILRTLTSFDSTPRLIAVILYVSKGNYLEGSLTGILCPFIKTAIASSLGPGTSPAIEYGPDLQHQMTSLLWS